MESKPFKVVIAGGSIAGLALALMLEKNGIDFIVLEGYGSIAPQVGASIGLLPNGLRILDQLGCYETVLEKAEYPVDKYFFRDSQGQQFWSFEDFNRETVDRHGYPVIFFDRRMLIEVLYDKIQDKSRVLTDQRVQSIRNGASDVTVTTTTGREITGNIVVGADGIHSTVRQEMWKEAQKIDPSWIDPSEASALPATYSCIFGISEGVKGIEKGTMHSVFNEHFSYLVPSGPGDRTYWFLVLNMGKTLYGDDIPRFSETEEKAVAKEHWNDRITPTLQFSDLYKSKIASVHTPLPEYVYKKWYFQRMMTIGDASHKFEPLTGQGGNNAIETAASLTNHLVAALKRCSSGTLSTAEISKVFENVQEQREDRVWELVKGSHARQRVECMETPLLKLVGKYLIPNLPRYKLVDKWIQIYSPSVSLNMIPQPNKEWEIAYYDERFRTPSSRGLAGVLLYAAYFFLAWLGHRQLKIAGTENGTWELLRQAMQNGSIPLTGDTEVSLRRVYTGLAFPDLILQALVTFFSPAVSNFSRPEQPVQVLYFLASIVPLMAIFTVEGYRPRNKWTLLAIPSVWGVLYQLRGIGVIAPIYFAASTYISSPITYFSPSSRNLAPSTARAILPAVLVGYVLPTMMLFFPLENAPVTRQAFIALWQPVPIYVVIFTEIFSGIIKRVEGSKSVTPSTDSKSNHDLPSLQMLYAFTGCIAACFHLALLSSWFVSGSNFLVRAFIPADSFAQTSTLADGIFIFFQNDFLLVSAASLLWSWSNVWDLYRMGISNVSMWVSLAGLALGYVAAGPGATAAAVWYWREGVMSQRKFRSISQ
ncbi:hypothetical protein N7499_010901 [Penicillium canescens]|uniref:FAD-binding domain-containing protein n=1 Tax=Penicillium canescens TaxID=5083 RepID=A0AAD6IJA9_PENCN|nr:uncharacterized protein N7446_006193 [Penicillium canescens]KAJ6051561.1 hypothetical protein N7460_002095 [Penicillium canescens]KAJ6062073.1 hypothetical protein N7446_006193 [Penicillium canescens]KAJ6065324.1 hypothetical protein N7444_000977 [Penicillium canescens]KAJ6069014.1 hypothetical protein N7499_010901 [Penicillium canescens]KAJ6182931.1 hypothetical protein N7485_001573 [Penicillium canescens]